MTTTLLLQGTAPTRPLLRFPGGKWTLAPWILQHCPPHTCYVEPFLGAGSVFFQKPRSYAEVLNDLDGALVQLFRLLRDPAQAQELARLLRLTPYARAEYAAAYRPAEAPIEQARTLLIRCWQGYYSEGTTGARTGWRSNAMRRGTLPAHDWAAFPTQIEAFTARLQGVIIEQDDALALFQRYDSPETLWYIDPPYVEDTCPAFHPYPHTVNHTALAEVLHGCAGMVLLSGYASPLYTSLYETWCCIERQAYAGSGPRGQRTRRECLWMNPACQHGLAQLSLFGGAS